MPWSVRARRETVADETLLVGFVARGSPSAIKVPVASSRATRKMALRGISLRRNSQHSRASFTPWVPGRNFVNHPD